MIMTRVPLAYIRRRHDASFIFRSMASSSLPSSLLGPPQGLLVPPGQCQFGEEFQSVPLLGKTTVSKTSTVFHFGLPDTTRPLNLSTCACILARADNVQGEESPVIRPYTPITTNATIGSFDLLVKNYGTKGLLSRHFHETLKVGDTMDFKHIPFNVKIQFDEISKFSTILMIAGGTGITPMIQALHAILGNNDNDDVSPSNNQTVTLLYGSQTSDDILARELLDQWAKDYSDKLQVIHILSDEKEGGGGEASRDDSTTWTGPVGYIDETMIQKYASPTTETLVMVCGPPPLYDSLSGPRDDPELTGVLSRLGYSKEQVYKF